MGLLDYLRRPQPIADRAALADFLDTRSAFIVQKCTYEYARARSGTHWQFLFKEKAFLEAVEVSRWTNYPLGMMFVAEMMLATLRKKVDADAARLARGLADAAGDVAARYPVPAGFPDDFWNGAVAEVSARLDGSLLAAPKPIGDIPLHGRDRFFRNLPIHASLTTHDVALVQNHLRVSLCRIYEDFARVAQLERLSAELERQASAATSA